MYVNVPMNMIVHVDQCYIYCQQLKFVIFSSFSRNMNGVEKPVAVIGGGLVGCVQAIFLAK